MKPLNCTDFEDLLDEFTSDELDPERREAALAHLENCERCHQSLTLWQGFSGALEKMEPEALPPLVERRIAVTAADTRSGPPRRRSLVPAFAAGFVIAAAAAAALVLGGVFSGEAGTDPQIEPTNIPTGEAPPTWKITRLEDGRRVVRVDEVTNLWVDDESLFKIYQVKPGHVRVNLERGRVVADIGPHAKKFRFVVATSTGEVEAKGTIFAVQVRESGQTITRVLRGLVEVREIDNGRARNAYMVGVGEKGTVGQRQPETTTRWDTEEDFCLLRGCPKIAAASSTETPTADVPTHAGEEAAADEPQVPADTSAEISPVSPRQVQRAEKPSGKSSVPPKAGAGPSEARELVTAALKQRRAGDYAAAAETYSRLVKSHGGCIESQNALVSLGQLELVNLDDTVAALSHFQSYLDRAPAGILAEEARLGKVRAHARKGKHRRVVDAATEYLTSHPGGYAGSEVILRRADARREMGDCKGAVADYQQLKKWWPTAPEAPRAERGIDQCLPAPNP